MEIMKENELMNSPRHGEILTAQGVGSIVNIEEYAMNMDALIKQINIVRNVMDKVMHEGEHYGTIPGTEKKSLWKPGAEKLCMVFRLNPGFEILNEIKDASFISYTIKCTLIHIPTNTIVSNGIGACNSRESKYLYRNIYEPTSQLLSKAYWAAKDAGNSKEMKRIIGEGSRPYKGEDGKWVIARAKRIMNENPWDLDNTLIKMACKRALVSAVNLATAASDLFGDGDDTEPDSDDDAAQGSPHNANMRQKKVKTIFDELKEAKAAVPEIFEKALKNMQFGNIDITEDMAAALLKEINRLADKIEP